MNEMIIYDKIRLFLQREKNFDDAVVYGTFSFLSQALGFYNQKRNQELTNLTDINHILERLTPLLKKAKKEQLINKLSDIVQVQINKIPNICFTALEKEIKTLLLE
ncbi:MAG: hypothetical protein PHV68_01510 [Candidatus Gastranaerophilales bacterium]|nr:hypothetical protein [Candidatus Gastranaerophilales bacterium]